jgi:release factor glutamine methyltransferase
MLADLMDRDIGGMLLYRREPIEPAVAARFADRVARRAKREPLQHILGVQGFHGIEVVCDGRALVPRPETEGLVDAAFELALPSGARAADLGTGSGCIAIAFAVMRPDVRVTAVDASPRALELARENVARNGVAGQVELVERDMTDPPAEWRGAFDLVMSNPPYVPEADWAGLQPEVREFDPRDALVPGPTGLEAYAALVPAAALMLRPGGHLLLELGIDQGPDVRASCLDGGFDDVEIFPDLREIPRVLQARRGEESR